MFNKLKQVQELKSKANEIKKALSGESAEGSGARGRVKVTMDGNQVVTKVDISDDIISNKSGLESGMAEATNDAIKKIQKVMAQKMSQMGGFPGLQ
jgi:DNA-binding YbaB/EbfC family protein